MADKRFLITTEHRKLVRAARVVYVESAYSGGFAQRDLYPYGSSQVYTSMAYILGRGDTPEDLAYLKRLHKEMATVVQIGMQNLSFDAGWYVKKHGSSRWEKEPNGRVPHWGYSRET